ncbi:MAG TPA: hypothetical protein VFG50_03230 [Rhodothermales bacterium]|nr:hypothetical protein [Rhodothermales bacterium]
MHPMKKVNGVKLLIYASVMVMSGLLMFQHADLLGRTLAAALLPGDASPIASATRSPDASISEISTVRFSSQLYSETEIDFEKLTPLPPEHIDSETLWLARCIYSESKREKEEELVAWVVRNRVETEYRGKTSYRDAILDPYQFSAFNPETRTRDFYSSLGPKSHYPGWQEALRIAYEVRHAAPKFRPFSTLTRHFYSEQSMLAGMPEPSWADGFRTVLPERDYNIEPRRFRFYAGIH